MRLGDEILSFMSTTMIFGTPVDVTLSELALETFFPADDLTAARMRAIAADTKRPRLPGSRCPALGNGGGAPVALAAQDGWAAASRFSKVIACITSANG